MCSKRTQTFHSFLVMHFISSTETRTCLCISLPAPPHSHPSLRHLHKGPSCSCCCSLFHLYLFLFPLFPPLVADPYQMFGPTSSRLASSGEWKSQKHKDAGAAISPSPSWSRSCHVTKPRRPSPAFHYHINFWPRFDLVIARTFGRP